MKKNDKITVITCAAAFALNVALFSVKLYVGLCANSISIYSDAVNNMFDSLSGLAAFICFAALLELIERRHARDNQKSRAVLFVRHVGDNTSHGAVFRI